eukprot:15471306-Alexandrium_andersonii.AAC.1
MSQRAPEPSGRAEASSCGAVCTPSARAWVRSSATVRCVSSGPMPLHWARKWRRATRPRRVPIARGRAETSSALAQLAPSAMTALT